MRGILSCAFWVAMLVPRAGFMLLRSGMWARVRVFLQGAYESRSIFDSLDIAWGLLRIFPRELLRRITAKTLDVYYDKESKAE